MSRYLVLAHSDTTARALSALLTQFGEKDPPRIVWEHMRRGGDASVEAYETLVRAIETAACGREESIPLNEVIVIVDSIRPQGLNAVAEGGEWDSQVAMLILTFPEICWIFGVFAKLDDNTGSELKEAWNAIEQQHSLAAFVSQPRRCPLFDPSGLRNLIRNRTNWALQKNQFDDLALSERGLTAAAIDEERPYAYLHAYTAYRFGYRADVITTWALMKAHFSGRDRSHGYALLLEDMSLNLPDRPNGVHLLHLTERARYCPQLDSTQSNIETSSHRILITTGQSRPNDNALDDNRIYLEHKNRVTGKGVVILKPAGGIFDIWAKAGLLQQSIDDRRKGNAVEPPALIPNSPGTGGGHGAPGKLLLIAETLIRRVEALDAGVKSVADAVRGAVLATEALELTGGRTPTTAIDALCLKHQFEVEAECRFSGVEYRLQIQARLEEITDETARICRWFAPGQHKNATLNAEMTVICALVNKLRDHSQLDEEQTCRNRIRYLHNTLWMRQSWPRRLMWPVLRYLELLLSSFGVFVAMLIVWLVGLSVLFSIANEPYARQPLPSFADAISSFFSAGPPIAHSMSAQGTGISWLHIAVACAAIISGFIHVGVFITHLYSMISRK